MKIMEYVYLNQSIINGEIKNRKKMKENCQIFKISLNQFKTNTHTKVMIK